MFETPTRAVAFVVAAALCAAPHYAAAFVVGADAPPPQRISTSKNNNEKVSSFATAMSSSSSSSTAAAAAAGPANIIGVNDPSLAISVNISAASAWARGFEWVVRDSVINHLSISLLNDIGGGGDANGNGNKRAVGAADFRNIKMLISNITCFNDAPVTVSRSLTTNSDHHTFTNNNNNNYDNNSLPPCVSIVAAKGISLSTTDIVVEKLAVRSSIATSSSLFALSFTDVTLEDTEVDVLSMEDPVMVPSFTSSSSSNRSPSSPRSSSIGAAAGGAETTVAVAAAPLSVNFYGASNNLVGNANFFRFANMVGKLADPSGGGGQLIRFESESPLDSLRLNIFNIFNAEPKATSRDAGNSPLAVEIAVPLLRNQASLNFALFHDVVLSIVGRDDSSKARSRLESAVFTDNTRVLITEFETLYPYPRVGRYGPSNIFIAASFNATSVLTIQKSNFEYGGGGISIGNIHGAQAARFDNRAGLLITGILSSYDAPSTIYVFAALTNDSHGRIVGCPKLTAVRFEDLVIARRSGLVFERSDVISMDFTSISFSEGKGRKEKEDAEDPNLASWLKINDNSFAFLRLENAETSGGHVQLLRNKKCAYTRNMYDATVTVNARGSGVLSDIEGALRPIVQLDDFAGTYEVWGLNYAYAAVEPVSVTLVRRPPNSEGGAKNDGEKETEPPVLPRRLMFSALNGAEVIVSDSHYAAGGSASSHLRPKLVGVIAFGCASVSTRASKDDSDSSEEILPAPVACEAANTMRRCDEGNTTFWFYRSRGRRETVTKSSAEPCYEDQP